MDLIGSCDSETMFDVAGKKDQAVVAPEGEERDIEKTQLELFSDVDIIFCPNCAEQIENVPCLLE